MATQDTAAGKVRWTLAGLTGLVLLYALLLAALAAWAAAVLPSDPRRWLSALGGL